MYDQNSNVQFNSYCYVFFIALCYGGSVEKQHFMYQEPMRKAALSQLQKKVVVCGTKGIWESSVLSAQFCSEPTTTLKKNLLIK